MTTALLHLDTRWQRTPKAAVELKAPQRSLSLRERAVLLFADGQRTTKDLAQSIQDLQLDVVERLVANGYLEPAISGSTVSREAPPSAKRAAPTETVNDDWRVQTVKGLIEPRSSVAAPVASDSGLNSGLATAEPASSADEFAGRRSLATARMFLLDLNQRMFTRRDPPLSERFHLQLRSATDREAMMSVAREMLHEIEQAAGAERADSIAERLAAILPAE